MEKTKRYLTESTNIPPVAVLFQSHPPPEIDHIMKPMKSTGYKDSSADIAVALQEFGLDLITPVSSPDVLVDEDWCFPDSAEGIKSALDRGAKIFWLNTILYQDHPITAFFGKGIGIVGQTPEFTHKFDDKYFTNALLRQQQLPTPPAILLAAEKLEIGEPVWMLSAITEAVLEKEGFYFPLVVKPLRGRGSQGVVKVDNLPELKSRSEQLLAEAIEVEGKEYLKYGNRLVLETFLNGEEITVTVMPPGKYDIADKLVEKESHWALPIVKRIGHHHGIAPYSGVVAVTENSSLLPPASVQEPKYLAIAKSCEAAAALLAAKAPLRLDCRFQGDQAFIFDVNLKPNMTGGIRPHRSNQNSLTTIAAAGINWDYKKLIFNIFKQAWTTRDS